MPAAWARAWFALTALLVFTGIVIQLVVAAATEGGRFNPAAARVLNVFAYFTIQANLLVGITAALLAVEPDRRSTLFRAVRYSGLVAITITGVLFHVLLAPIYDFRGWAQAANVLLHYAVPLVAVLGWLVFGPRGGTSWRVVGLSLLYSLGWVAFTLVRGALIDWYPYPFLDVGALGYGRVLGALGVIALAFAGLAAAYHVLDPRLGRRAASLPAPAAAS